MEKSHDEETSRKIFALILKFAGYGFNRSHSVAYSLIAYKMAYLKVHYPNEFFANLLTNVIGSEYKTKEYILEARKNQLMIEKPDINLSSDKYVRYSKFDNKLFSDIIMLDQSSFISLILLVV